MLILVSGASGSGKSEYAEGLVCGTENPQRIYLATMQVWDNEDRLRVARHRRLRQNRGFVTVECPREVHLAEIPPGSCVLLECLSNLCANECFGERGFEGAEQRILEGLDHLQSRAELLVVVTNELFADGVTYPQETERYLALLAGLNRTLAARADRVCEVVCGIPIVWKGEGE